MINNHTFTKFKELTENCTHEDNQNRELTPNFVKMFKMANAEYCRIHALSEIINIPHEELVNLLLSNALGDAHEGFLGAFSKEEERNKYNQQLKQRVKELMLLSSVEK